MVAAGTALASVPPEPAGDLGRLGVFAESLVAIGAPDGAETEALMRAALDYRSLGDPLRTEPLESFLHRHPGSAWQASLWLNIGLARSEAGDFTRALEALEAARAASARAGTPGERAVAERAVAELLWLNTLFGRPGPVAALLETPQAQAAGGVTTAAVAAARAGLWEMTNTPGEALRCGVVALAALVKAADPDATPDTSAALRVLDEAKAAAGGLSLAELEAIAAEAGLSLRSVRRPAGAAIPVPAVVHWTVGHYGVLLAERDGRYRVRDPALRHELWMSRAVLERQSSGYFLVPATSATAAGWSPVAEAEARQVRGGGYTNASAPGETGSDSPKASPTPTWARNGPTTGWPSSRTTRRPPAAASPWPWPAAASAPQPATTPPPACSPGTPAAAPLWCASPPRPTSAASPTARRRSTASPTAPPTIRAACFSPARSTRRATPSASAMTRRCA